MSTKGIGHYLSFWTPVGYMRPAGQGCYEVPKSKWPAYFSDLYWHWGDESVGFVGPSLKGCELAITTNVLRMGWKENVGRIVSYGFFALHYALRRCVPAFAQNRFVSPILWAISLVPVAMGIAKVWCRYGHRYYVYSKETGDDGIPPEAKMTLDEKVFGEWGKIDRLPAAKGITAEEFNKLTPGQMAEPIKKYIVAAPTQNEDRLWEASFPAAICMKLERQVGKTKEQMVYSLLSQDKSKGKTWAEGPNGFFLGSEVFIEKGELLDTATAGVQALRTMVQGGKGKDPQGNQWELAK